MNLRTAPHLNPCCSFPAGAAGLRRVYNGQSKPSTLAACSRLLQKAGHAHVQLLQRPKTANRNSAWKPVSATSSPSLYDRDIVKEESRKYRRTVFTFENWAAHRSERRYKRHVLQLFQSRIVRGLLPPLVTLTGIATFVAVYQTLLESGTLPASFPKITFESGPFSSTSFALSLLLVFRTNTSYARWLEARTIWGGITNRSRDIVRQAITFTPPEETELVEMYKRWSIAYSKTLMCHLREDEDYNIVLKDVLKPDELQMLLAATHRPNYVLQVLSELIEQSNTVSPERFRMDQNLTFFHDAHGACERILKTPIPLSYTRHTSRFLVIWLAALPFTLWKSCHLAMIPASGIIAFLLLGIEEIGVQIEEPFSILPLEAICTTIETNCHEMTKNAAKIKELTGPVAKLAERNGNGSGRRSNRDTSFATPDIASDHSIR